MAITGELTVVTGLAPESGDSLMVSGEVLEIGIIPEDSDKVAVIGDEKPLTQL